MSSCSACGAELTPEARFCASCGTVGALHSPVPRVKHEDPSRTAQHDEIRGQSLAVEMSFLRWFKRHKAATIWAAILAIAAVLALTNQVRRDAGGHNGMSESLTRTDSNSKTESDSKPVHFPELRLSTSGRLPITLHSISLGMSVAEAIQAEPTFRNSWDGSEPDVRNPDSALQTKTSQGFTIELQFREGRLVLVSSKIGELSPADATEFQRNTLDQLGKPTLEHWVGYNATSWVWIDGNVGLSFENSPTDLTMPTVGSRRLELQIAVYPELLDLLSGIDSKAPLPMGMEYFRQFWGLVPENVIRRQMPSGLFGLELGMRPWQVREIFKGINISDGFGDGRESKGFYQQDPIDLNVFFWNGTLCAFCYTKYDVSAAAIEQMRSKLLEDLGTPTKTVTVKSAFPEQTGKLLTIDWEDQTRQAMFMLDSGSGRSSTGETLRTSLVGCLSDKRAQEEAKRAYTTVDFKPPPPVRSFF